MKSPKNTDIFQHTTTTKCTYCDSEYHHNTIGPQIKSPEVYKITTYIRIPKWVVKQRIKTIDKIISFNKNKIII